MGVSDNALFGVVYSLRHYRHYFSLVQYLLDRPTFFTLINGALAEQLVRSALTLLHLAAQRWLGLLHGPGKRVPAISNPLRILLPKRA
jgi:hypothetical protein